MVENTETQIGFPSKDETREKNKKQKSYRVGLERGIVGKEYACYLDMSNKPTILVKFLHNKNNIYKNNIKIFINKEYLNDIKVNNVILDLKIHIDGVELVNELFYEVQRIMLEVQKQNFEQRVLDKIPLLEYRACPKDYLEYRK